MNIVEYVFKSGFGSKDLAKIRKNETIDAMLYELDEFMKNPTKTNRENFTLARLNKYFNSIYNSLKIMSYGYDGMLESVNICHSFIDDIKIIFYV